MKINTLSPAGLHPGLQMNPRTPEECRPACRNPARPECSRPGLQRLRSPGPALSRSAATANPD